MSEIARVGADLAKRVIQVHAVDASGKLVTNRINGVKNQWGQVGQVLVRSQYC